MSSYIWTDSAWVKDGNGKPVVVLFGRDPDTLETKKLGVKGFVPYFYAETQDVNYDAISCFGDHIVKIKVDTPDRVPIERQLYAKTFEADIPFDVRYTIDQRIFYAFDDDGKPTDWKGTFTPKIGFWDIEVKAPRTVMPQAKNPKYPIVSMSLCDSYTKTVYVFTWNNRQVKLEYEDFNIIHIPCTSEQMVLTMFAQKVHELDFDVMTAWNGQSFDDPYYVKRAQVLDVSLHNLARLSHSWISERRWQGRVLVDMMKLFIDWSKPMGKMPFGLKYIAKEFADFEYDDQGANIESLMSDDKWEEIVEYSAKDVIAMYKINEAVGLFPFFENIRRVMGVKLNDVLSRSVMIETLLAKRGIKPMPTRTYAKDAESAQGATVLKPVPGVHGNVGVVDAKALYPTIIIMHNISPDIDNMIPITIVEMMEEREKLRKIRMAGDADEFMKNSETAIKYIVNAFYGYMLFRGARLFDKKCGAQVTREGRKIIKLIGDHIERLGYSVLYGDTDSTFTKGIRIPEDGMSMEVSINDYLKVWAMEQGVREEFVPTVKFEKLYSRIMFKVKATKYKRKSSMAAEPAKKRYAGHLIWKDGFAIDKMDFVGLEIKRSDNSALTRKAMVEFFEVALTDTNVTNAAKIVKKYYNDVLDGKVSISEAGIPKGVDINKKGAWQTGMEHGTELLGIRWSETPKPKLLHTLRPYKVISIDDDIVELPDHIVVNWELMAEKIVKKKFESLLMSIGITWDTAINGQKTLESWF